MYIHLSIQVHAHRRIDMTISSFRKHLIPSLVMASAAFFGTAAGAGAADLKSSDPQDQARQLLAPTTSSQLVALSGSSSVPSGVVKSVLDPQELARRLLTGADRSENTTVAAAVSAVGRNAPPSDSQALAQRMILGAQGMAKTHTATTAAAPSRSVLE
jgi:hypothetical protein